jgi:hypothetical protein
MSDAFYLTEELKKASISKPLISHIPEDGRDPDPSWDHMSRSIWPSTLEDRSSREALANELMYATNDPTLREAAPVAVIIMARMCQRMMGDMWTEKWLWDNQFKLKKRVDYNRRNYGVGFIGKLLRKIF